MDSPLAAEWARERRLTRLTQALLWIGILVSPLVAVLDDVGGRRLVPVLLVSFGALVSVVLGAQTRVSFDRRARATQTLLRPYLPPRPLAPEERESVTQAAARIANTGRWLGLSGVGLIATSVAAYAAVWTRESAMWSAGAGVLGLLGLLLAGIGAAMALAWHRTLARVRHGRQVGFIRGAYFSPRPGTHYIGGVRVTLPLEVLPSLPTPGEVVEASVFPGGGEDARATAGRHVLAWRPVTDSSAADVGDAVELPVVRGSRWIPKAVGGGVGLLVAACGLLLISHAGDTEDPYVEVSPSRLTAVGSDGTPQRSEGLRSTVVPGSSRAGAAAVVPADEDERQALERACDSVAAQPSAESYASVRSACLIARRHTLGSTHMGPAGAGHVR